jgi:hypothetical protein
MRINLYGFILLLIATNVNSQNVGIGTNSPTEKLDVNGAIKIGNTTNTAPGTIRWNEVNKDFEGYNGIKWISLTLAKNAWGNITSTESYWPQIKLNPGSANHGRYLGVSLAATGNYILAGASRDNQPDGIIGESGSVRILKKINGSWIPYDTIYSPNPQYGAHFGTSVDISDNLIIAGAPKYGQGRAYIFQFNDDGNGASTTTQSLLTDAFGTNSDMFGYSVAIKGNYAAAGAPYYGNEDKGRLYSYRKDAATGLWLSMGPITPADAAIDDHFGLKVAMNGQYMAVSSPYANVNGLEDKGKVYIYKLNAAATGWDLVTTIWADNNDDYAYFGKGLFFRGDTLLVGAPGVNLINFRTGRVYMYVRNGDNWQLQTTISTPGDLTGDEFGTSVFIDKNKIVIGAPTAVTNDMPLRGKVFVFINSGSTWNLSATLVSSSGNENEAFGYAVHMIDNDIISGAPGADAKFPPGITINDHGKVYIYHQ